MEKFLYGTEILKRCNIDDIVLEYCNRALEYGHIPES